ncbi:hypothetical protein [Actinomadura rupiterrae]|uniref:hypothetical protein n=1 Tax=Actinomadura rupiterrae TaxID=559627 RepID=UPI0020A5640D|nr:hypothetical protein [Actinomadura rupiterrae]MCP2343781.1 hypothetical protein [Actinomadura rupiterrae]
MEFARALAPSQAVVRPARRRERAATLAALAVIVVAVPAAVLVLPDTSSNVVEEAARSLRLAPGDLPGLLRATGLSVPVLLAAVPVGAVAARRFGARPVLLAGLALLVAGLLFVGRADDVLLVGAVRAAQGAGAGLILPATLVLAWERGGRLAPALWSGALVASLLAAMPLALDRVPLPGDPDADAAGAGMDSAGPAAAGTDTAGQAAADAAHATDWHAALAPFPWFAAAVAVALPLCLILRGRPGRLPALRHTERGQLVLPLVPAAGFAFIAVVSTYDWSPGGRLALAALALLGLVGLALVASRDATAGSPFGAAVVMVTTGLLAYPIAAPLAGIAAATARNGDGASFRTYLPFAAGAAAALVAALVVARLPRPSARPKARLADQRGAGRPNLARDLADQRGGGRPDLARALANQRGAGRPNLARELVVVGHVLIVSAVVPLLVAPVQDPVVATAAMVALGGGAGLALAAALRGAGVAAALFGLSLCFPAVLTGQLVVLSLQAARLQPAPATADAQLAALTGGYRMWLDAAALLAVLLAAAGRSVASGRGRAVANRSRASASVQ